jgi:hypothetical protein
MFRTEIHPLPSPIKLNLSEKILTVGSCFSDSIGKELVENKFTVAVNPFGSNYNPHSIHKSLRYAIHNQVVPDHTYVENKGVQSNYDFHSNFAALDKQAVIRSIKEVIGATHYFLKDAQWIFITYGTAWVYERKDTGDIVANCHKVPAGNFNKLLLSQKKVLESFKEFYTELKAFNPTCKIILTVSPVRHIKDTLQLNSVSKSVLRLACQTITEAHADVFYFPSYEIMMDDLRDYRFYKSDMIHPSKEAERYIFSKFSETYFDESTHQFLKQWQPLRQALKHKPFLPESESHQQFLKNTLSQLDALQTKVNLSNEISLIKSQLL